MTNDELKAIEERVSKATPGPWAWRSWELGVQLQPDTSDGEDWPILIPRGCGNNDGRGCKPEGEPDDPLKTCALMPSKEHRDFIAHSRTDIPALLAEVRRLQERIKDMESDAWERSTYD